MNREGLRVGPYEGLALMRALAGRGVAVFSIEDARSAAVEVGVGPTYLKELLRRLREGGWVHRLKRGTYALAGGMPGLPPELHPFAVGMALVEPSAVSGWAALNYQGLTEQVPRIIELTTPRRVVTPAMRGAIQGAPAIWQVGTATFEIVSVVPDRFFGYQEKWLGEQKVKIFDMERATIDCFALPRRYGGIAEGMAIVSEHLDELDVGRLVGYAQRYGSAAVAKRVGFALEVAGAPAEAIGPLYRLEMHGHRPLDPTRPVRGPVISGWGLRDNLRAAET